VCGRDCDVALIVDHNRILTSFAGNAGGYPRTEFSCRSETNLIVNRTAKNNEPTFAPADNLSFAAISSINFIGVKVKCLRNRRVTFRK